MSKISHRAQDKLQALLNRNWDDRETSSYIDACATWFAGLTDRERETADLALHAYMDGDAVGAQKIAAALPAAPKCPLVVA